MDSAYAQGSTPYATAQRFGNRRYGIPCLLAAIAVGCSRGPTRVSAPSVNSAEAGAEAIRLYDKDGDGKLSGAELDACPGIKLHLAAYDSDGDGAVSQTEIEAQLQKFVSSKIGQTNLQIAVVWNGRPLAGATVKLVPEPYLGAQVKPAYGTTGQAGKAAMDIRDEDLPASEHGIIGVHCGTYKIEVTHPNIAIPEQYNAQTTLGYETEFGNPGFKVSLK